MALISNALCTVAEVKRKVGDDVVLAWADHDEDHVNDTDVIEDAINQATEELLLYLGQRYSDAGLAGSTIVNRWCVTLACYFLSTSRGNSPSEWLEAEFQRLMEKLPKVQNGTQPLPGVSLSQNLMPTMSNLTIDQRWRHSKIRVTPNSSVPPTTLSQDTTYEGPAILD